MKITDDQIIDRWLASRKSPASRERYGADIQRFVEFLDGKKFEDVEIGDVQRYAKKLERTKTAQGKRIGASRQASLINAVKSLYKFACKFEYLKKNPSLAVSPPAISDPLTERLLTREEVDRMIAAVEKPRDKTLLTVIFYSGARVSEVISLQWRNVRENPNGGQLTLFGKGGKQRVVAIPPAIYEALCELRETANGKAKDYIFPSQKSPQMSRHQVFRIVKMAAKKAGLSHAISTHWLRHAHATIAIQNQTPLHIVQKTLGHGSIVTTQKYLHALPDESSGLNLDKKKDE